MDDMFKLINPVYPFPDQLKTEESMTLKIEICFFTWLQLSWVELRVEMKSSQI